MLTRRPVRADPPARRFGVWTRLAVVLVMTLPAAAMGVLATQAARATERFGPVEVSLGVTAAAQGQTRLETVLGDVVLDRHLGPDVHAVVSDVAVGPVLSAARSGSPVGRLSDQIDRDRARVERLGPVRLRRDEAMVARLLVAVALAAGVAAFLTAAVVGLVLSRRGLVRHPIAASAAVAAVVGGGIVAAVLLTRSPAGDVRTGWLAYGTDRADVLRRLDQFDRRYADQGRYVLALLDSIDQRRAPGPEPAACLVAISDIHSRNVLPLVRATVDSFPCTVAVVDAGDAVDWGTSIENQVIEPDGSATYRSLGTDLGDLGVPYLVVRGNHDSGRTMDAYREAGATVLDGPAVTVGGLRVLGRGHAAPADDDALFTPDDGAGVGRDRFLEAQDRLGRALARDARREDPDVVVVHTPRAAADSMSLAPVVVTGHLHRQSTEVVDGTFHLQLGSVGGAGLRAFDTRSRQPKRQEWAVIRFDASCRLLGATLITADSLDTGAISAQDVDVEPRDAPGRSPRRCGAG